MTDFRNVLVAFDSDLADTALDYGRTVARAFGSTLHVIHASENLFMRAVVGDPRNIQEAELRRVNERLTDEDRQLLKARVVGGTSDNPAEAIVDYARREGIDLIVTATHGRSGLEHALIGSVTEHVMRTAPCPVLTVRRDLARERAGVRQILVATDFGEAADAALASGRALASRFGATIHALHVVPDTYLVALGEGIASVSPTLKQDVEQAARSRLNGLLAGGDKSTPTTGIVMTASSPSLAIVEYAKEHAIDLIVQGTHGRGTLARMLLGSVAERVVRIAPCPVLTVKH